MTSSPADPAVTVGGGITASGAVCSECEWDRTSMGSRAWLATRAAARRHVRSTGHPVYVSVTHGYTYAHVGPPVRQGAHV